MSRRACAELVEGLESRRDVAVAGVRIEAAEFRDRWNRIDADERSSAVTAVFVLGEKLFSETEPRVATTASPELVLAVEAAESCRHVVQMP